MFTVSKSSFFFDYLNSGTIIDNKVCHPKNNDFYLCSHAGMIVSILNQNLPLIIEQIYSMFLGHYCLLRKGISKTWVLSPFLLICFRQYCYLIQLLRMEIQLTLDCSCRGLLGLRIIMFCMMNLGFQRMTCKNWFILCLMCKYSLKSHLFRVRTMNSIPGNNSFLYIYLSSS